MIPAGSDYRIEFSEIHTKYYCQLRLYFMRIDSTNAYRVICYEGWIDSTNILDLKEEIETGMLEVEWSEAEITVRLKEKSTFNSGDAKIKSSSFKVIDRISESLNKIDGNIIVAGHSDNIPISNYQYRSNWELSAARAANVVHHLTNKGKVDPYRVQMRAHAETKPLVPNDNRDNRARNRRVEIVIEGNNHLFEELHNKFGVDNINSVIGDNRQSGS